MRAASAVKYDLKPVDPDPPVVYIVKLKYPEYPAAGPEYPDCPEYPGPGPETPAPLRLSRKSSKELDLDGFDKYRF